MNDKINMKMLLDLFSDEVPKKPWDNLLVARNWKDSFNMFMCFLVFSAFAWTVSFLSGLFSEDIVLSSALTFLFSSFLYCCIIMCGRMLEVVRQLKAVSKIAKEHYFDKLMNKYNLSYTDDTEKAILKSIYMLFMNGRKGHFVVKDNLSNRTISLINEDQLDDEPHLGKKYSNCTAFVGLEDFSADLDNLEPVLFVRELKEKTS